MSTRSHQGCWTCKRRRRRCDSNRPKCQNCAQRGIECEGYEVRLRWGSGIASRGQFTGADKPLKESVPVRTKGRRRDLSRERKKLEASTSSDTISPQGPRFEDHESIEHDYTMNYGSEPSPTTSSEKFIHDQALFNEFINGGINVLHSTTARDSMLQPRLPQLCQESSALYTICLAFQLSLSSTHSPQFLEYFDAALREFRSELAQSTILSDGTLTAGLLLCSIGLMHGLPWTVHLEGMHSILQCHGLADRYRTATQTTFRTHLLEVMGVMDLQCFSVGRQTPCIGIWHRYCQPTFPREGVEPVSGLPRTLLDLFAGIGIDTTEQSFWDWPGEVGSFLQCYLWEAHRLAGILTLRRHARSKEENSRNMRSVSNWRQPGACPADAAVLVARILANLDALRLACAERPKEDTFIKNAVLFPVVVAGLEVSVICKNTQWQETIRKCTLGSRQDEILLDLLEEMWQKNDPILSVDNLARARGVEMVMRFLCARAESTLSTTLLGTRTPRSTQLVLDVCLTDDLPFLTVSSPLLFFIPQLTLPPEAYNLSSTALIVSRFVFLDANMPRWTYMPRWARSERGKSPPRHEEPKDENEGQRRAYCIDCRTLQHEYHQCTPICQRCGTPFFGGMGCEPTSYCGALPCCGCCNNVSPPAARRASGSRRDLAHVDTALAQHDTEQIASQEAASSNQPKKEGKTQEGHKNGKKRE
ncbi:hypothetical protein N7493_003249 [Penicillium malachiteum]|uniref:Zn(2)-C6 fungal-type domain-containing protein n=1 Tax=Penicillium malachiteum TaxID=1324776 RepID=A0AAD6HTZ2_9EURO|nr:hypothetical protein N7493_003249 [Penicillium malachiteum]